MTLEETLSIVSKLRRERDNAMTERDELLAINKRLVDLNLKDTDRMFDLEQKLDEAEKERDDAIKVAQDNAAEVEKLKDDLEPALADAARYRWLRDKAFGTDRTVRFDFDLRGDIDHIDAAIDAALGAKDK